MSEIIVIKDYRCKHRHLGPCFLCAAEEMVAAEVSHPKQLIVECVVNRKGDILIKDEPKAPPTAGSQSS